MKLFEEVVNTFINRITVDFVNLKHFVLPILGTISKAHIKSQKSNVTTGQVDPPAAEKNVSLIKERQSS